MRDALVLANLSDLIGLPDAEAAPALSERIGILDRIQRMYERSYAERAIIVREFERRSLWKHLADPETGEIFPSLTAWLSCSDFLGCRRVNFEALRTGKMLADIPSEKLIDVPKGNLHTLTQLSTAVRNQPDVLEAAKSLPQDEFLAKVEKDHPQQHLQPRRPLRFSLDRGGAKAVEEAIAWALEKDIAGTREEALVRACETALNEWQLEDELAKMPVEVKQ